MVIVKQEVAAVEEVVEREQIIERVAALDIGKQVLTCCVRVPGPNGRRQQEVVDYSTMAGSLAALADRLHELGVTRVVMEATSDYWRPPFYVLEAAGFEVWLVNARDVKHLPGRPKTDRKDAVWLCKVAERQMLRPSFVPPADIRQLRQLTRYRRSLVVERTAEKQRVEKLLEDAGIKLSVVASDIFGVSGRQMMAALIAGQRDPETLAQMARGRLRVKHADLVQAFSGWFTDHHGWLLNKMLDRVDLITADIVEVEQRIAEQIAPFERQVRQLMQIPGVNQIIAWILIAEIGTDMSRFPTPAHLASWAKFAPGVRSSAGRQKGNGASGHGNRYLAAALGDAVLAARPTKTFLGARYRRLSIRRGPKRAIVAVGRSMLNVIWYLLANPDATYQDLGPDFYERHVNTSRARRNHIRHLEQLGYKVTLEPAVA